ncbi:integrase [Paraburkholderia tropica]|uniref:hypothetical protein n=1 Tax=Paraburkholderia tropica TaxID=92647 RepID=UPI001613B36A|nr:hypothetical protein [Paraburkholderia tropica]MBB3001901.1 integrase [Paraburkholderia tropica]MBB6321284.1 integrase [Paraburkholderia tropica]
MKSYRATKRQRLGDTRIELALDWATVRGYRSGDNPARWRGHLDKLLPKSSKIQRVEHHLALQYAELGGFITELKQQAGTAARTGETFGARRDEFDLTAHVWVVLAERMKMGKEHRVVLSPRCRVDHQGDDGREQKRLAVPFSRQAGQTIVEYGAAGGP